MDWMDNLHDEKLFSGQTFRQDVHHTRNFHHNILTLRKSTYVKNEGQRLRPINRW